MTTDKLTYKQAGVDIDAGNALVEAIKPAAAATSRPGVMGSIGGFGGLFDLKACGFDDPVLVAGTDGVGTKLSLAIELGRFETIGVDLVAMCVNDILSQGAEPLFFLDYYATGRLEIAAGRALIDGIAEACRQSGCALLGGETAEMPGLYKPGDFDLAGFAVGAVERGAILPKADLAPGEVVIGLGASGVHANGFSLVRKIVERSGLGLDDPAPFAPETTLGAALLTPTRLYVAALLPLIRQGRIRALAHITGGGLAENLARALPDPIAAEIDACAWPMLPVFRWLAEAGSLAPEEGFRTFNCGIGMVAIVREADAAPVIDALTSAGQPAWQIGTLRARTTGAPAVAVGNRESALSAALPGNP